MPIKNILVVDDSPTDLKYLTDLLAKNGYQVVTAQNADEALAKGLVNRVVDAAELDVAVEALASRIVAKPRVAIAMGKALFYRQLETGIADAYADAGQTMACNMMDACALDGVQAFVDQRKAKAT